MQASFRVDYLAGVFVGDLYQIIDVKLFKPDIEKIAEGQESQLSGDSIIGDELERPRDFGLSP